MTIQYGQRSSTETLSTPMAETQIRSESKTICPMLSLIQNAALGTSMGRVLAKASSDPLG